MRTILKLNILLCAACLCIPGCNSGSTEDDDYDDMTSRYDTYTVAGLWEAMEGDEDVSGTYILLQDEVYGVQGQVVTLMDSETDQVIDCEFQDGFDLTGLAEGDVITVGGVCYFMESSSYPELHSCDYYYVNSQG